MIRFFKSPQPAALFSIPLIVILLWAERFISFPVSADTYSMPLWSMLEKFFLQMPSWLNLLIFMVLISFEAIYFNLMVNKHEVLYKNSYLPALFFVLIVSATPEFVSIHPIHFVNLILLRIFDKIFALHKQNKATVAVFDCGFLTGIAVLLYLPAVPIIFLLMFSLSILRPFQIKEWLVLIIGYTVPFLFTSVLKFWNHGLSEFWTGFFIRFKEPAKMLLMPESFPLSFLFGVIAFLLLLSWLRLRANYYKNIIRIRTYQQILFFAFLLGFLSIYLSKNLSWIHFLILTIPVALWLSYFFVSQKKKMWMVEGLLLILIIAIVWNHFQINF